MPQVAFQDSRRYQVLPQSPEEAGYYSYGTPGSGAGQHAHPRMLTFLFWLEHRWSATDARRIGIGNISLADGRRFFPHASHRSGLEVDIRPMRKDMIRGPVRYFDAHYDQAATCKLVDLMWQSGMVGKIYFNDASLPRVQRLVGHDNHLHVEVIA